MKLTEKEIKTINTLIAKALDKENQEGLSAEEVKELQRLLKKVYEIEKKAKEEKASLSEVLDISIQRSLAEKALKVQKQVEFEKLPPSEKFQKLKNTVEELQKSPQIQKALSEQAQKKEEEEFEKFYGAYVQKHGRSL